MTLTDEKMAFLTAQPGMEVITASRRTFLQVTTTSGDEADCGGANANIDLFV